MCCYTILEKENQTIIHIDNLGNDLKDKIRTNLTKICHGVSKSSTTRKAYSYKSTIKEFIERYKDKPVNTQKGMIGELLAHLFILELYPVLDTVSPYFNMEEKSIKKGFDIILYSQENNDLWITEVKSGELHTGKTSNQTNNILLTKAKDDLKDRLNENKSSLWENAINGAKVAIDNNRDIKDAVVEILGDISDSTIDNQQTSKDKNVVLVSSLFTSLDDKIDSDNVDACYQSYIEEDIFNKIIITSIQKETYQKVVDFLILEGDD